MKKRYFICKNTEGCRLSDVGLDLSRDQLFSRDATVAETSRSIRAALRAGWIDELTKSKYEELKTGKKPKPKTKTK